MYVKKVAKKGYEKQIIILAKTAVAKLVQCEIGRLETKELQLLRNSFSRMRSNELSTKARTALQRVFNLICVAAKANNATSRHRAGVAKLSV